MRKNFILLWVLIIANVANAEDSIQDSTINKLHQRALVLLAKYNLNPTNKSPFYKEPEVDRILPRKKYFILDTADSKSRRHSKLSYKLLQDASKSIGLDPAHYIGKRILRLNYLLDDSTRSNRIIEARVLFSDTKLVGACLSLDGYSPGIVALNNRSQFKPKNFLYPKFNHDLIDSVSILGPWGKSKNGRNWINRVDLISKEEISYFAKTFSESKKVNADLNYWIGSPGDEYAASIRYKTGEWFFPHFIFRNDSTYLNSIKCYYILDSKFIDFIKEIIKSRGIKNI